MFEGCKCKSLLAQSTLRPNVFFLYKHNKANDIERTLSVKYLIIRVNNVAINCHNRKI